MLSCGCTCVMAEAVLPNDWIPSGSIRQNRKEEKNSMSKQGQLSHKKSLENMFTALGGNSVSHRFGFKLSSVVQLT